MRDAVTPRSRAAWRQWLETNHAQRQEVWLVFYKKGTGKPSLSYDDAVEEALCFGWIDGIKKRIDDERYTHRFSPRTAKSKWSAPNKRRIAKLERAGLIAPAGRAAIDAAKRNGEWIRQAAGPATVSLPRELEWALERNAKDAARFADVPASHRRAYMTYVADAKQAATRERRARKVIELIRAGGTPIDV